MTLYLLFESASGYALFERVESEEIGADFFQKDVSDIAKFGKIVKLKSFLPFKSAQNALENANDVSEGLLNDYLSDWLETVLPKAKPGKRAKFSLGVSAHVLGGAIQEQLSFPCESNENVMELLRGIRQHFDKFLEDLKDGDIERAQLGLGHSYSRSKVKFNVNRSDNMIIQSICLLDQLDKDLNTFVMRVREWYSWHFPECGKLLTDNLMFVQAVILIQDKTRLTNEDRDDIEEIVKDEELAQRVIDAGKTSMGQDISDIDLLNITNFAKRVVSLTTYRDILHRYLKDKMHTVAPNLAALIGEHVGARLISHAGSLTSLAKYPASTVQILGAEKALFRALKTKGNTPKYGLIFHSSFIGRAGQKNKGRISRHLANKCSIASRIDAFSDVPSSKFGEKLREQVEERLQFYETGAAPRKNQDVMDEVIAELKSEGIYNEPGTKRRRNDDDDDEDEDAPKKKKKKKSKKSKKAKEEVVMEDESAEEVEQKKKKKKKSKKSKKSKE